MHAFMEEDINLQLSAGTAQRLMCFRQFLQEGPGPYFQVCAELKCESCSKGRAKCREENAPGSPVLSHVSSAHELIPVPQRISATKSKFKGKFMKLQDGVSRALHRV